MRGFTAIYVEKFILFYLTACNVYLSDAESPASPALCSPCPTVLSVSAGEAYIYHAGLSAEHSPHICFHFSCKQLHSLPLLYFAFSMKKSSSCYLTEAAPSLLSQCSPACKPFFRQAAHMAICSVSHSSPSAIARCMLNSSAKFCCSLASCKASAVTRAFAAATCCK